MSVGSENNRVEGNQFTSSGQHGIYLFEGNDLPELEDDGTLDSARVIGNFFTNNVINGYGLEALKLHSADGNVFAGNVFIGLNTLMLFTDGTNNALVANLVPADTVVKMDGTETNGVRHFTSVLL